MIRAVLDTNTLVSAIINIKSSVAAEIYQNGKEKHFLLISSPSILAEVEEVLHREKVMKAHKRSTEELQVAIGELAKISFLKILLLVFVLGKIICGKTTYPKKSTP